MKRFLNWFRSLPKIWAWVLGLGALLFAMAFAVVASATAWEYTNSPEFCGTTCHTMPPEYTAYQVSPHARVACVDCHLGQKSFREAVPAKAKEISHVTSALFSTYQPPIYVKNLRPARETCEQCHNPDKFSFDTFEQFSRFASDGQNSEDRYYLTFKTGGGKQEQGLGRGIHWHIDSEVYYFTDDPLKQTIPYVKVVGRDGQVTEYFDTEAGLPPDFGTTNAAQLKRMDCIDCHNRISHNFRSPENSMDEALNFGRIDKSIPSIKQKGVEVLSQPYETPEQAHAAIDELETWYRENFADYYAKNQDAIAQAVAEIKGMFDVTVFPGMSIGWQTHPNNIGHKEFPGCFRCHDGKHVSPDGEAVRLECNVCHSVPEVVKPGQQAPVVSLGSPNEPESHKDSNWLARHRYHFEETCTECHTVDDPGGISNTSFCSNSACHGTQWVYAGLNAPTIRELVAPPKTPSSGVPNPIPHPVAVDTDCARCHGPDGVRPYPANHAGFGQALCTQCHVAPSATLAPTVEATPTAAETTPQAPVGGPPAVPHPIQGRENCGACHGETGPKPYPADHAGRPVTTCTMCHQAEAAAPEATPPAQPAATATPVAAVAPAIPHPLEGRENQCLTCHYTGSIKPFPANHEGFTNEQCLTCHALAD